MSPTIEAATDHLPGTCQGDRGGNDVPVDVVGDTQPNDKGDGEVDEDEPAYGVFWRSLPQVSEWDIAEDGEGKHADQGHV